MSTIALHELSETRPEIVTLQIRGTTTEPLNGMVAEVQLLGERTAGTRLALHGGEALLDLTDADQLTSEQCAGQ